ncbi:MAG TPA: sigma-70 family RNA polymerase sigma factor [Gaiellaceae bacterium]|nr:sigma-70 family RNA polymerase sigma factor [Gaiellaceae bacterium]
MPRDAERGRLIESYLPLVHATASRFAHYGEPREELEQVGALALVRAVDRRDPARSLTLRAYLARCVEGEMRRHLRDRAALVRIPRRIQAEAAQARRVSGSGSSVGQQVATARRPLELRDGTAASEARELDELTLARALISRASRALDPRERQLVLLRFFCDCTQAEVAAALGVSQAHVSRLLASAMAKMRRRLEVEESTRYPR